MNTVDYRAPMTEQRTTGRRAPAERQRDAARTKARLLDAAREVFADKGLAGARVQDIASRAGVDKQLINYYFGGKDGLYAEIWREWQDREADFGRAETSLPDTVVRYLEQVLADPRLTRVFIWHNLDNRDIAEQEATTTSGVLNPAPELEIMRERRERGQVAEDLDEAAVVLALTGAVTVAATMPHLVQRLFGLDADDPEFARRYAEQLRRIAERLSRPLPQAENS